MILITKNTDYALRALMHLAGKKGGFVSSSEIAGKEKIPLAYLRRILQTLQKSKMIVTKEGSGGGACLQKPPDRIFVYDVIRAFQGDISLTRCIFREKHCHNTKTCLLRKEVLKVEDIVSAEFKKLTLKSLINTR